MEKLDKEQKAKEFQNKHEYDSSISIGNVYIAGYNEAEILYLKQIEEKDGQLKYFKESSNKYLDDLDNCLKELQEARDLLEKLDKLTADKELFEGNILKEQLENFLKKT